MKNFKSPSKYSTNFCLTVGSTGEISMLYELPLPFVFVSLYLRLYLTLLSVFVCYCHRAASQMVSESLALYRYQTRQPVYI
jgi:hypothetical protein